MRHSTVFTPSDFYEFDLKASGHGGVNDVEAVLVQGAGASTRHFLFIFKIPRAHVFIRFFPSNQHSSFLSYHTHYATTNPALPRPHKRHRFLPTNDNLQLAAYTLPTTLKRNRKRNDRRRTLTHLNWEEGVDQAIIAEDGTNRRHTAVEAKRDTERKAKRELIGAVSKRGVAFAARKKRAVMGRQTEPTTRVQNQGRQTSRAESGLFFSFSSHSSHLSRITHYKSFVSNGLGFCKSESPWTSCFSFCVMMLSSDGVRDVPSAVVLTTLADRYHLTLRRVVNQ
ncbi:hypothetical protein K456DRAFT_709454 [Colletotrichum gloeosporioides 23]|nr:hypothetical protein K456DRAFT_709454 [Colletotrichum gloeosporioides 23]